MLHRVHDLTGIEPQRFWGGTFHSIGNRALRMFGDAIGLPKNFTILDADESETLLKQAVESTDKTFFKDKTNPRPGPLFSVLSLARNTQLSLHDTVERHFPQYGEISDRFPAFAAAYEKKKREDKVTDYDDLLELWLEAPHRGPRRRPVFQPPLPPRPRRRIPGHQHHPGPDRGPARLAPPRHGRGRRRAVHLLVARRRLREHHVVPRPARGHGHPPHRDQLPLDARDPRLRQRRAQRPAQGPPLRQGTPRRPQARAEARRHPGHGRQGAGRFRPQAHPRSHQRGGRLAQRDRRPLPLALPRPRDAARPHPRRRALHHHQRREVLRAPARARPHRLLNFVYNPSNTSAWNRLAMLLPKVGEKGAQKIYAAALDHAR
jgi:DNA helicase-2/ATP-dependent DNA helicase PcrA